MPELTIIKPEDAQKGAVYKFSDQFINLLRKEDEIFVVGLGTAVSLAATAVSRVSNIASVNIEEVSIGYVGAQKLGLSGIFFVLNKKPKTDWEARKKELEKDKDLSYEGGQLLIISKNLTTDRAIPLALSRIAEKGFLKITSAGLAINRAVPIALELIKGGLALTDLCIPLILVTTVQYKMDDNTSRPETVVEIFVTKGKMHPSKKHEQMLKMMTTG